MTHLKLLTYNAKLMPHFVPGGSPGPLSAEERAARVVQIVTCANYDVVCLEEVFDEDRRADLTRGFQVAGYTCSTKIDAGSAINQDSGLFIATRTKNCHWLGNVKFECYIDAKGADQFANKGIAGLRLRIEEHGQEHALWLFWTHTQADARHEGVRAKQFAQARRHIARHLAAEPKPAEVVALLGGDLNVVGASAERDNMRQVLGEPIDQYFAEHEEQNPGYTWDGPGNPLAGGTARERLDYWLAFDTIPTDNGAALRLPTRRAVEVEKMRSGGAFLSDHYGVRLELDL